MDLDTLVAGTARLTPCAPPGLVSSWLCPTDPGPGSKLREFWSCLCLESLALAENDSEGCRHRNLDPEPLPGAWQSIFITQQTEILSIILMCWQTIGHYLAVSSLLTLVTSGGLLISSSRPGHGCVLCPPGDQSQARMESTETNQSSGTLTLITQLNTPEQQQLKPQQFWTLWTEYFLLYMISCTITYPV